jgi:hypothetical protein
MIKFFRKIRQKLLTVNPNTGPSGRAGRLSKYLLYAIGEIALVVIGILLALQINNWNEEQKLQSKENEILREIKSELSDAISDLKDDIDDRERNIRSAVIVANSILQKQNFNDSLRIHFMLALDTEILSVRQSGFEGLEYIGVEIISNDTIRQMISDIYLEIREYNRRLDSGFEHGAVNKLRDILEPYLKIDHNIVLSRQEGGQTFFGGNRRLPFEFTNYASFLKDEQFLYALVKSIENRAVSNLRGKRFQTRLKTTVEKIDQELNILEKR